VAEELSLKYPILLSWITQETADNNMQEQLQHSYSLIVTHQLTVSLATPAVIP
jgi:hypothetical protein